MDPVSLTISAVSLIIGGGSAWRGIAYVRKRVVNSELDERYLTREEHDAHVKSDAEHREMLMQHVITPMQDAVKSLQSVVGTVARLATQVEFLVEDYKEFKRTYGPREH